MATDKSDRVRRIQQLNDAFRTTFLGGRVLCTPGVSDLSPEKNGALLERVQTFDQFNIENDPHHEQDFGSIEIEGTTYFWKIDYYNKDCTGGSETPTDPDKTTRVLTIMRADEY
jgi:hypothetical protein